MLRLASAVVLIIATTALGCGNNSDRNVRPDAVETGPTAQEFFLAGNAALNEEDYRSAIREYSKAVEKDPKRWDAHMNKAIAHSRSAEFELALGSIEQAFQNGGADQAEVYYNLGNIYQERGMYKESIAAYRAGLSYRDGTHVDSLINIGAAYVFLRRFEEATATFEHLRDVAPDEPAALHGLALIQHLQDNYQVAVELYEEVHAMAPSFANSYFNKASVLARQEKWQEAIDSLRSYLRYAPDGPYAKKAKASIQRYETKAKK